MAEPIRVDFQVGGIKEVQAAFRSIIDSAKAMGEQMAKAGKAGEAGGRAAIAAKRKAKTEEEKLEAQWMRSNERMVSEFHRRQYQERQRADAQQQQQNKRAARALVQGFIQAQEERQRAAERGEQYLLRLRQRYFLQTQRAEDRANHERIRAAEQTQARVESIARSKAGFLTSSASNAISRTAAVAGTLTGFMGGFTVADSVQKGIDARGAAADLANQSGRKVSSKKILETASKIGSTYGMDTTEVIKGLDAFVAKSGDVIQGLQGLSKLTELATATGANMGDLLQTAGIIHMGTGKIDETLKQMRVLAGAGREGSVDMRELAQYAGRISAGANQFTDKGKAFSQLSAIVQQAAATGGATAAPEATEAVTRLATDVAEKEDKFKALGIETRDKKGKFFIDPKELIQQAIIKTKGDSGMLLELFGKMSYRAVAGFQDLYNRQGGGKAGLDAMNEAFDRFENAALTEAAVREDAARRLQEADKKFAMALNDLRDKVAADIIPVLVELAPKFKQLIPQIVELIQHFTKFASWFAANPMEGLGAVLAGQIVLDIGKASIGAAVQAAITAAITGGTAAGAVGAAAGAASAAGGAASAAGAGAAAAGFIPRVIAGAKGAPAATARLLGTAAGSAHAFLGTGVIAASGPALLGAVGIGAVTGLGVGALIGEQTAKGKGRLLAESIGRSLAATNLLLEAKKEQSSVSPEQAEKRLKSKEEAILKLISEEEKGLRDDAGGSVFALGAYAAAPFTGGQSLRDRNEARQREMQLREKTLQDLATTLAELRTVMSEKKNEPQASMLRPETTMSMATPLRQPQ